MAASTEPPTEDAAQNRLRRGAPPDRHDERLKGGSGLLGLQFVLEQVHRLEERGLFGGGQFVEHPAQRRMKKGNVQAFEVVLDVEGPVCGDLEIAVAGRIVAELAERQPRQARADLREEGFERCRRSERCILRTLPPICT